MKTVSPAEFFDAIARRYDRVYGLDRAASRERMAGVLAALPPASRTSADGRSRATRVLDLGVGTGRELGALQDAGYDVTGLDLSRAMLELCARRARPIPLVLGDLWEPLPFDDASFDAAIALHGTLAHAPNSEAHPKLARELARVLGDEGVFVSEVPSRGWAEALTAIDEGDRRIVRAANGGLLHEDRTADVAIEATIPSDAEWRAAFSGAFGVVTLEVISAAEIRVTARKTNG